VCYCKPIILTLRRLRQEDCEFEDSLGYIKRYCLNTPRKKKNQQKQKNESEFCFSKDHGIYWYFKKFKVLFIETSSIIK
jgi:hypothetical protein